MNKERKERREKKRREEKKIRRNLCKKLYFLKEMVLTILVAFYVDINT